MPVEELAAERLRREVDPAAFTFHSTEELEPLDAVIGQERAVRAISFGIGMTSPGYHIFAVGPPGTGKTSIVEHLLETTAATMPLPDDWLYVNNFEDSNSPRALRLPAGLGCAFEEDMTKLVEELATEVPNAFEGESYEKDAQKIQAEAKKQQQAIMERMNDRAEERGFRLVQTPHGTMLAPFRDDELITPEEFNKLEESEREQLEATREELAEQMRVSIRDVQEHQRSARERLRELDREVVRFAVEHLIDDLREKYAGHEEVVAFLDAVRDDIVKRVGELKQAREMEAAQKKMQQQGLPVPQQAGPGFDQYRVNLVVENCDGESAPVVIEHNPTSHNLVGRIEHEAQFGALVTNFTMIRPGALHRANGGYLVLEAREVLMRPFAWGTLKRTLKDRQIKIETAAEDYMVFATRTLKPEPIPLDVKVVLVGDPWIYHLLNAMDDDFRELFKVQADFGLQTEWEPSTAELYARFVGRLAREEELRHFAPSGVARLLERASRLAADREKLTTTFADLADLVREASFWAADRGSDLVEAEDVRRAVDEKVYRANRIEERLREMIEQGTLLIDTEGAVVGQVNGLSVLQIGQHAFGKPSRVTARTHVGSAGVVNIERETKMGGRIHTKGVLTLVGFLGGAFARDIPLALSASLTFEQLYEGVEGDSASSTELYALLSSLADLPVRQDLAVTGSVNQHGQVQPIGGVNEKVEGFFDVCRARGLTGTQGVLIPQANVRHLMLREDVVQAVAEGRFHVYPVTRVEEGIELLTGRPAGERGPDGSYPEGTVYHAVEAALRDLAMKGKQFAKAAARRGAAAEAGANDNDSE